MADVAVFHASLMAGGGAETVGAHAIQALVDSRHDISLYSTAEVDTDRLETRHDVDLPDNLFIQNSGGRRVAVVDAFTSGTAALTSITDLPLLRRAAAERGIASQLSQNHDLVVSTDGPFTAPGPVLEYVHFPYYDESAMRQFDNRFSEALYPTYHRVCRTVRPKDDPHHDSNFTLTNSNWTANILRQTASRDFRNVDVLRPPVRTDDFNPPPPDTMENGFVSIGRIHPLKRQHFAVEVIDELRRRGVQTHLHIVGDCGSAKYFERLRNMCTERSYVDIERSVSRSRIVKLIEQHRYGIHARKFEHFGIAVAEMVAGDTLPFVHDSGGQIELIPDTDTLAYTSFEDAARKMERIFASPEKERETRSQLHDIQRGLFRDKFAECLRESIDRILQ